MTIKRPEIPEPLKRQIRQECGFGCAICGMPIFDYEHIIDWAIVKEHKAENIVLLCPNHHAAKTRNRLSIERVYEAKANPINKCIIFSNTPFCLEKSKTIEVYIGSNRSYFDFPEGNGNHSIINVNNKDYFVIHASKNYLTFSLNLTDQRGNTVLSIVDGQLKVQTEVHDFNWISQKLTVNSIAGRLLEINLSNNRIEIIHGSFFSHQGSGFLIKEGDLTTQKNGITNITFSGCSSTGNSTGGWSLEV